MVLVFTYFLLPLLYTVTQCSGCLPSGWGCGATACFYIYTCHDSFTGATQACTQRGLTLASVASYQERQFLWDVIVSVAPSDNLFWLGGTRDSISDQFSWLDGSPFPFTNETSHLPDLCLRYRGITFNDFESNQCDMWHQYVCKNGTGDMPPANMTTTATTTQMTSMMRVDSTSTTTMTRAATATTTTSTASMSTTATTPTAEMTSVTTAATTGSPMETTTVAKTNNPVTTETSSTTETQQVTTPTQPTTSTQTTILTTSRAHSTTGRTTTVAQPTSGTQPIMLPITTVTQPISVTQRTMQPTATVLQAASATQPTIVLQPSSEQWTTVTIRNTTMEDPASSSVETTSANTMTSNSNVTTTEAAPSTLGYSGYDVSRESTSIVFGEISTSGTTARDTTSSPGAPVVIWRTSVSDTPSSDNVINGTVPSSNQSPGNLGTEPTVAPTSTSAPNTSLYQSTTSCECCAAWKEFLSRNLTSGTFRLDDLLLYKKKKLQTVDDTRISARGIGGSAVALLVISFLTIVVLDAGKLFHDFSRMYKHLREAFRPQNVRAVQTNRLGDA